MKYYKYKMDMLSLNIICTIFFVLLFVGYYILFPNFNMDLKALVYVVLWMFLHEIIHGLTFMSFKEVDSKNVVFGAKLESGIFYCMCKQPISKKVIYSSLVAPLILIGIITLIIALIFNLPTIAFLSVMNIGGCVGDIMMSLMFFKLPKDIKYTDLDDCEGFVVLSKDDLTKGKYLGFKLVENGKYIKEIAPKEFKKINISKTSLVILIIILVAFIISLF